MVSEDSWWPLPINVLNAKFTWIALKAGLSAIGPAPVVWTLVLTAFVHSTLLNESRVYSYYMGPRYSSNELWLIRNCSLPGRPIISNECWNTIHLLGIYKASRDKRAGSRFPLTKIPVRISDRTTTFRNNRTTNFNNLIELHSEQLTIPVRVTRFSVHYNTPVYKPVCHTNLQ